MKHTGLTLALAWMLLDGRVLADDWPHWRGPLATGVSLETGLPVEWNDSRNVAWRAPLGGTGVSSPVVAGDRVFVTSQAGASARRPGRHPTLVQGGDPAAAGERPLASAGAAAERGTIAFLVEVYHRADGRRLWTHRIEAVGEPPPVHEKHNLASSSAATDGERVYAWFGTGQLVALDMQGRPVWSRHLGADYGPFVINWGHGSSPVVFEDMLLLLCYHEPASYLLALDKRTGAVRWKADRGRGVISYSTPLVVRTGARAEVIVNSSQGLDAYDAHTGEPVWRIEEASQFPIPMPVHQGAMVYTSRGYRSGPYWAIRTGGKGDVSKTHVAWRVGTGAPYISSLVLYEGLIYMAGDIGVVTVVDAKTGERVWQDRVGGVYTASPVAGDGKIYLASESGETVVLAAGREMKILSRNKLAGRVLASPAISNGQIFIRTDGELVAVGKAVGS